MVDELVARIRAHDEFGRRLQWLGGIDDGELTWLYQNAFLSVTPSLYEGLGVPVIEALSHGCPTLSSTGGALPEAGTGFSELFDPDDRESLTAMVARHLDDDDYHSDQVELAFEYSPPTWVHHPHRGQRHPNHDRHSVHVSQGPDKFSNMHNANRIANPDRPPSNGSGGDSRRGRCGDPVPPTIRPLAGRGPFGEHRDAADRRHLHRPPPGWAPASLRLPAPLLGRSVRRFRLVGPGHVRSVLGPHSAISLSGQQRVAARSDGGRLGIRRTGLLVMAVGAVMPFAIRYGSEARMYAIVTFLSTVGYLLVDDLLLRAARRIQTADHGCRGVTRRRRPVVDPLLVDVAARCRRPGGSLAGVARDRPREAGRSQVPGRLADRRRDSLHPMAIGASLSVQPHRNTLG